MNHFFNSLNAAHLKYEEIQHKFVDGVGYMLVNYANHPEIYSDGIVKLWKLKDYYEQQLENAKNDLNAVKDVEVCFRCFDKKEGPCHDCD